MLNEIEGMKNIKIENRFVAKHPLFKFSDLSDFIWFDYNFLCPHCSYKLIQASSEVKHGSYFF